MPLNWENRAQATNWTVSWLQCAGCGDWFTAHVHKGTRKETWPYYADSPSPDKYHPECWTQFLQDEETRRLMRDLDRMVNDDDDWDFYFGYR